MAEHVLLTSDHSNDAPAAPDRWVAVVGRGMLATAIQDGLRVAASDATIVAYDSVDPADLVEVLAASRWPGGTTPTLITASDSWDAPTYARIHELCTEHGVAWLPIQVELGRIVMGPWCALGVPGCVDCVELRRSLADEQHDVRESVRQRYPQLAEQPSLWLTALAARTVAAVVTDEVLRWGAGRDPRTQGALLSVDLDTLAITVHRFLADAWCPRCGALPIDEAAASRVALQPRPKPTTRTYRVRTLGEADLDWLRDTYTDEQTGLIRRAHSFPGGNLAVGVAYLRSRWQDGTDLSWGRTLRYRTSEIVALLEALERFGGMAPGGRRTAVAAAYAEVSDHAIDPRTLGLYPPEQYGRPGFHFQPFDVDRVCRWVWGYSFERQEPILVPQAYAYYRAHAADPTDPSFAFEVSNGCALGSCLEEAILYGILEVLERDAFLMTWYARLPAPRIDLSSAQDRTIPMLAKAIEAETGYRLHLFDTTMEHGVPSVWAMAVHPPDPDRPALACSAGAHLDPERAASGALCELGPILEDLIARYPEAAERARRMAEDASLVTTMDDHSVLYTSREAAGRLDFLVAGQVWNSFAEVRFRHGNAHAFQSANLTDDLREVVGRLRSCGLDVIVVNQTTPEHQAGGFSCVKVIVPGTLPMTFGHEYRRVHGLPRLYEVPKVLGYRDEALTPQEINPHPHPFP